jgi:hypothetical protein
MSGFDCSFDIKQSGASFLSTASEDSFGQHSELIYQPEHCYQGYSALLFA